MMYMMNRQNRHEGCKYFIQNAWMMAEGKYICSNYSKEKLLFVFEVPPHCRKGFCSYLLPEFRELGDNDKRMTIPSAQYPPIKYGPNVIKFEKRE